MVALMMHSRRIIWERNHNQFVISEFLKYKPAIKYIYKIQMYFIMMQYLLKDIYLEETR